VKTLTLSPVSPEVAAPLLAGVMAPDLDTGGGLLSLDELLNAAECFEVIAEDFGRVGAYAVQIVEHENGREAVLLAGVGQLRGADLTAALVPAIAEQARVAGCKALTIYTRRRGLYAKLRAQDFRLDGYILRKGL
jgi:hypothetical protein